MTNPIIYPKQNYSGVTIQILNPAVNVGSNTPNSVPNVSVASNDLYTSNPIKDGKYQDKIKQDNTNTAEGNYENLNTNTYPAEYYMNKYGQNNEQNDTEKNDNSISNSNGANNQALNNDHSFSHVDKNYNPSEYKIYANENGEKEDDLTTSQGIIGELNKRAEEVEEEKKNSKEKRVIALTDEYIKSLENYLNNPNDEIRLMASKEILTRLDEDKDRYDDAALNALLNKMLQDPSKLIRIAALSAFASQLASGNDYTVKLLNNIQTNPNADKEDALQAADILLKMSAGTEVKRIPYPQNTKTDKQQEKVNE